MQPIYRRPVGFPLNRPLQGASAGEYLQVVNRLNSEPGVSGGVEARSGLARGLASLRPDVRLTTVPFLADQPPIDGVSTSLAELVPTLVAFRQGPNDPPLLLGIHSNAKAEGAPLWALGSFEGRPLLSISNLPEDFAYDFLFDASALRDGEISARRAAARAGSQEIRIRPAETRFDEDPLEALSTLLTGAPRQRSEPTTVKAPDLWTAPVDAGLPEYMPGLMREVHELLQGFAPTANGLYGDEFLSAALAKLRATPSVDVRPLVVLRQVIESTYFANVNEPRAEASPVLIALDRLLEARVKAALPKP